MSQNKQRLSWLEMLKVNQRAYLLFYKRYPRMILSRFALIIWKALTPYVGIYFSALIIEELAGAKNPGRIRFLVLLTLFLIAAGSLVTALLEKWKNVQSAGMKRKIWSCILPSARTTTALAGAFIALWKTAKPCARR